MTTQAATASPDEVKERLNIEVKLVMASVKVNKYVEVCVEWARNAKKVRTKSVFLDQNISKGRFSKGANLKMPNTSFFKRSDGTWRPDYSTLTLMTNDNEVIGVCTFNNSDYCLKPRTSFKAVISDQEDPTGRPVLLGDTAMYPGAYIEFKLSVLSKAQAAE